MSLLLPLLIFVPLAGAVACALLPSGAARRVALIVSLLTAGVGIALAAGFDYHQDPSLLNGAQGMARTIQAEFGESRDSALAIQTIGFKFHLGADTISLWLILLTVGLTPLAIAASFDSIKERQREYYGWMLALLAAMLGVFLARDLLLFYIFFELTLVPMFFIIAIWGGPDKRFAAGKFFLFTFTGSVFTLAGVIYLANLAGTFDLATIVQLAQSERITSEQRFWLLLAFLAGFAVKVPLFPVHTWLPLAHTEAPTAGSVILAGVLLKLGTYGLLRLAMPIGMVAAGGVAFPFTLKVLGVLCVIGIIYGALVAWVQRDIKKLVAYSSVSHLGFCVLGLLAMNEIGMQGSVLYMINHGISTGALFLVIGMIYDRYHTRDIDQLSGLAKIMPIMAFFFMLFTFSSIGLPGTNGFVSEFLTVLGAFTSSHLGIAFGAFAALGVILGAVYMLHMAAKVIFGPLKVPQAHDHDHAATEAADSHHQHHAAPKPNDLNAREIAILIPLAIVVIVLGVMPTFVMNSMKGPLKLIREPLTADNSPAEIRLLTR